MRPVDGVARSSGVRYGSVQRPEVAAHEPEPARETSRAVITLQPVSRIEPTATAVNRTNTAFLAQLIATQQGFPQTRERRRREPEHATASYARASARIVPEGHILTLSR